jgi:hypothetical protein
MTETIDSAKAAASTLFLGQSGEFWDFWLIASVILAAIMAGAIGVTTMGSIVAHKREAAAAEKALAVFRISTAAKISETDSHAASAASEAARANERAAQLTADNLALQTVLMPRHAGLFGINEAPRAGFWFAGFQQWAGTKVLIQVVPGDPEAQNVANEIASVLAHFGWRPEFIDEKRSGVSLNLMEGVTVMSPSSYKGWDPNDEAQKTFRILGDAARSLAAALTKAGLGVGSYPVSGVHGLMIVVDSPPDLAGDASDPFRNFSPKLDGVYLQVGSRPVSLTIQWIKSGGTRDAGKQPP